MCGCSTRCTSSNMDHLAVCGFHRRSRIRCFCMRQRGRAWGTSALSDYATESLSGAERWRHSMDKPLQHSFAAFLKKLRKRAIRSRQKIVIILDNARFHHARLHKEWREQCQEYFALVFLPPYSPELNTIERTWKLTRRLCTHNRYFAKLDEVVTAVEGQFQQWSSPNEQLRLLCSFT